MFVQSYFQRQTRRVLREDVGLQMGNKKWRLIQSPFFIRMVPIYLLAGRGRVSMKASRRHRVSGVGIYQI